MKVKIAKFGTEIFNKKIDEMISIYNDGPRFSDDPDVFVAYKDGLAGGMLISVYSAPNDGNAIILLAAFNEEDRRKGHAKDLLRKSRKYLAKRGADIVAVELDLLRPNPAPWEAMGFTHKDTINLSNVLLTKPLSELFGSVKRTSGNGISINDLYEMGLIS